MGMSGRDVNHPGSTDAMVENASTKFSVKKHKKIVDRLWVDTSVCVSGK